MRSPFRACSVEGAGKVIAVGEGVQASLLGPRVAWAYAHGSYAEQVAIPAAALAPVPDDIDDRTAAAIMMQGLTASHFATDFYPVQVGDIALVHAAAGGLGLLVTHIIKLRGGRVIGRVSSDRKVDAARQAGADHVIVDTKGAFAGQVRDLTGGEGVHVVYDGSGPKTFQASLDSLRRSGVGGPGPIDIMSPPRSIKIGYAVFSDHIATPDAFQARTARLFQWLRSGDLAVTIRGVYPLADAARAHGDMESRATTGKLLLVP